MVPHQYTSVLCRIRTSTLVYFGASHGYASVPMRIHKSTAITKASYNAHTNPIEKRLKLLSIPDIHQIKLLCLYKRHIDNKVSKHISLMFANINLNENPNYPKSVKYKSTTRFEMPTYLQTAPTELLNTSHNVSYCTFKANAKKYIIERYSSLCTVIGCGSCNLQARI